MMEIWERKTLTSWLLYRFHTLRSGWWSPTWKTHWLMSPVILQMASNIRYMSLPHDFFIIDHLENIQTHFNYTFWVCDQHQIFFFFNCGSSHQDEHKYWQDVEDSVSEQRPPAQGDRLERDESCTRACTHKRKANNVWQNYKFLFRISSFPSLTSHCVCVPVLQRCHRFQWWPGY